ncbi:ExeA family protein [Desulfobacula phenolica]|uniref:Type II secretory pathway, component ExeA (Predicted ATPase) n=1 Tax=Desulfobacula phenolica TaxID=90732 RepID=A0A1H2FT20_9BACT|nr:AAA family ATPase [Desulfobacula phenolica]SDU10482.1 Type II secretory pathway, component ExeA (predicted ATPase) [Desulfobacula phenolica]
MDYYKLLDFKMEPFSNSPDPRLFYRSSQHLEVLQKLEISIRLKRGLNVVAGDIGTGKTTVSRQLIQKISNDTAIEYYLILDPGFRSVHGFLTCIVQLMMGEPLDGNLDESNLKERIKTHLFTRGVDENINTVLVIDEGQKLSLDCLEVLRELLNFETNSQKLLQIVIFAQNEFDQSLDQVKNFQDRINFRYTLTALNFKESKALIQHRLNQSFVQGKQRPVFSAAAFVIIYAATKGSPRKMVTLCHQVILALIIKDREKAGAFFVRSCVKKMIIPKSNRQRRVLLAGIILAGIILAGGYSFGYFYRPLKTPKQILYPVSRSMPVSHTGIDVHKNPSIQTVPPSPAPVLPSSSSDVYGSILVPEDATIYRMITLVYGKFSPELLNQVMAYNSTISAPDRLLSGFPVRFPVPAEETDYPDHTTFLVIYQTREFNRAFNLASSVVYRDLDVRILPFHCQDIGYQFNVVVDTPFNNLETALAFLRKVPPGIAAVPQNAASLKSCRLIIKEE